MKSLALLLVTMVVGVSLKECKYNSRTRVEDLLIRDDNAVLQYGPVPKSKRSLTRREGEGVGVGDDVTTIDIDNREDDDGVKQVADVEDECTKFDYEGQLCMMKLEELPVGYKFLPTEFELIEYLKRKITPDPLPTIEIQDMDATQFFATHPKELVRNLLDEREWYFFIRNDDDDLYNKSIREVVGHGDPCFWMMEEHGWIYNQEKTKIGYKIISKFYRNSFSNRKRTHWKLEEFHLPHKSIDDRDTDNINWTLARLIRGNDYGGI